MALKGTQGIDLELAGGGGGVSSLDPIGTTPNADGATITGSVLNLEPADGTNGGVLAPAATPQTIGGNKTLTGHTVINAPTLTGASVTPALAVNQTWNTTGIAQGVAINITNTASNFFSTLFEVTMDATTRLAMSKQGALLVSDGSGNGFLNAGNSSKGIGFGNDGYFSAFSSLEFRAWDLSGYNPQIRIEGNVAQPDIRIKNKLYVGDLVTAATEAVHVNGNVRFSGALMPNNAPGTAGEVLTSAGAGLPPIWTTPGGGADATTANNGLTETGDNIQLGGALIANTSITGNFQLGVSGNVNSGAKLLVTNGGTSSIGVSSQGTNMGVSGSSDTGYGLYGFSNSGGNGVFAGAFNSTALIADNSATSTNTVIPVARFQRQTTGTAANGIGLEIQLGVEVDSATTENSNKIISKWTNAVTASRTSELSIIGMNNALENVLLSISGAGVFTLVQGLADHVDDAAASAGGIPINGLYRTGSAVKIRVS